MSTNLDSTAGGGQMISAREAAKPVKIDTRQKTDVRMGERGGECVQILHHQITLADTPRPPPPSPPSLFLSQDVTRTHGYDFEDYSLKRELLIGIFEKGFEKPSPIQEEAMPIILQGRNVLARAKNGTGKTAAFCIPILQVVDTTQRHIQAIVLVPTRELALQTVAVLKELGKHLKVNVMSLIGGTPLAQDILRLQDRAGVHILVGTPERIRAVAKEGFAKLGRTKILALDEADKLLSPEFQIVVEDLLTNFLPKDPSKRQILLFSATFPITVVGFRDKWMPQPYEINLMEELTLKG